MCAMVVFWLSLSVAVICLALIPYPLVVFGRLAHLLLGMFGIKRVASEFRFVTRPIARRSEQPYVVKKFIERLSIFRDAWASRFTERLPLETLAKLTRNVRLTQLLPTRPT